MSRLRRIRPLGVILGGVTLPRARLLVASMLVCVVAAASPSFATAADKKVDVGMANPGEAEGSLCLPEANGEPGEPHSLTYADLKGGALEVPDDGKIITWSFRRLRQRRRLGQPRRVRTRVSPRIRRSIGIREPARELLDRGSVIAADDPRDRGCGWR